VDNDLQKFRARPDYWRSRAKSASSWRRLDLTPTLAIKEINKPSSERRSGRRASDNAEDDQNPHDRNCQRVTPKDEGEMAVQCVDMA
jgi:hypothetical protein